MDGSGLVLMEVINVFIVMHYHRALCSRRLRKKMMKKMSLLLKSLLNKRLVDTITLTITTSKCCLET